MRSLVPTAAALAVLLGGCFLPEEHPDHCDWGSPPTITADHLSPLIIAPGGTVRLHVEGSIPQAVTAEPQGILSLVPLDGRYELDAHAITEGAVTLSVEDTCGKTGSAAVEVRPAVSASVLVQLNELRESYPLPAAATAPGIAVLPGGVAILKATPLDATGRRVHEASLTWSSTAPTTLDDTGQFDEEAGTYFVEVKPAEGVARAEVSTSLGGEVVVAFPQEAEVADALLVDSTGTGPLTSIDLATGASRSIGFFPLDAMARPIFGASTEAPGVFVHDDRVAEGSPPVAVPPQLGIPRFDVRGVAPGETDVELSAFGLTRTLHVRVRPAENR